MIVRFIQYPIWSFVGSNHIPSGVAAKPHAAVVNATIELDLVFKFEYSPNSHRYFIKLSTNGTLLNKYTHGGDTDALYSRSFECFQYAYPGVYLDCFKMRHLCSLQVNRIIWIQRSLIYLPCAPGNHAHVLHLSTARQYWSPSARAQGEHQNIQQHEKHKDKINNPHEVPRQQEQWRSHILFWIFE